MRFREGPLFQHRDERRGFSRVFTIGRILAGTALLAWLAGCGKNTITPQPAITPSQSATVGAISVPPPSLFSQMTAVFAFDQSSLPGEKPPLFPNTLQRVSGDLSGADIPIGTPMIEVTLVTVVVAPELGVLQT